MEISSSLKHLQYLVEKIGPRHASTDSYQNDTLLYIFQQLSELKANADPSLLLEIELVRSSPYAFTYYQYPNAATILAGTSLLVARISKRNVENSTNNSLLLSCHPDSVPGGLAGT